jgi:Flp pilus assembly protein TadG
VRSLIEFKEDKKGSVAIIFAFMAIPMIGMVGLAVDYSRLTVIQNTMQTAADDAALAAAWDGPNQNGTRHVAQASNMVRANFSGDDWLLNLNIAGRWVNENNYRVDISAPVNLFFINILPNIPNTWDVSVRAIAQLTEPTYYYKEPEMAMLDPEAGDYNRLYAYCYNRTTDTRTQEIAIADNAGTKYNFTVPQCESGEALSYRLYNVRNSRTSPDQWDRGTATRYNFYTDTVIRDGVEDYTGLHYDIVETVLCDSLEVCKPHNQGGVIPEGRDRVPQQNTRSCEPGKFMYYGWEDRPPGLGWTDRDYDDIRLIIECPTVIIDGEKKVRLVG